METDRVSHSARLALPDDLEAVNDYFLEHRLSDGSLVIPPTEERVRRMLAAVARDPDEKIGVAGGAGGHWVFIPTWGADTRSVMKAIRPPGARG